MLFGNSVFGSTKAKPASSSSLADRYAAMVAANRENKSKHKATKALGGYTSHHKAVNKPTPAPAPLAPATGSSYQGQRGTYEQKVLNNDDG